jgi:molybdopterin/thiamine biosynthesis adenylyltransferase
VSIEPWFERYPELLEQEKEILLRHGFQLDRERFARDRKVVFVGTLPEDPDRELTVSFPDAFPSFPPRVFDSGASPLLRRHHHPGTRQLCLFGPGDARWYAQLTSESVLAEAAQLLKTFGFGGGLVENDDVPEPALAVLSYRRGVAILVPPPISSLEPNVKFRGQFVLRCDRITNHSEAQAQGIVFSVAVNGRSLTADPYYRELFDRRGSVVTGPIVFVPRILSGADLVSEVQRCLDTSRFKRERWFCILFQEQSGIASGTRLAWLFIRQIAESRYELIETFAYRDSDRVARIPVLHHMSKKKITIIGCGCLGSKIAAGLATSGLEKVTLVDRERYEPNNSVRHEVEIRRFGENKVNALADRLLHLNPALEVTPFFHAIGGVEPSEKENQLIEHISSSDLVVDTTGSHGVSRWLNERVFLLGVPAVFVSVTNGAWAGEIVRVVPSQTACWLCWNSQYGDDTPPGEPTRGVFPPGCGQPSFTGSTFETGMVANLATSLITATLLPENEGMAKFDGDYLRWIGRTERDYVLKTEILSVAKRPGCALCNRHA